MRDEKVEEFWHMDFELLVRESFADGDSGLSLNSPWEYSGSSLNFLFSRISRAWRYENQ